MLLKLTLPVCIALTLDTAAPQLFLLPMVAALGQKLFTLQHLDILWWLSMGFSWAFARWGGVGKQSQSTKLANTLQLFIISDI